MLGSTLERCTLPDDLAGRLEGKSSLGRLGLLTHSTAGFIDPGFTGHITLELSNVANLPITLWPGMKIGQLCLLRLTSPAEHPYGSAKVGSKYQGQRGPTPSRSYQNFIKSTEAGADVTDESSGTRVGSENTGAIVHPCRRVPARSSPLSANASGVTRQLLRPMKYLVVGSSWLDAAVATETGSANILEGSVDIVLGVSMTPTTVRMVLVEGEKADGVTVDHDTFDVDAAGRLSNQRRPSRSSRRFWAPRRAPPRAVTT